MITEIKDYVGDYEFLDVGYLSDFTWANYIWHSAAHALMGSKFSGESRKAIAELKTMDSVFLVADAMYKNGQADPDWDEANMIKEILAAKFGQNQNLQESLAKTKNIPITGAHGEALMEERRRYVADEDGKYILSHPDKDIHNDTGVLCLLASNSIKIETLPEVGAVAISGPEADLLKVIKSLPSNIECEKERQVFTYETP